VDASVPAVCNYSGIAGVQNTRSSNTSLRIVSEESERFVENATEKLIMQFDNAPMSFRQINLNATCMFSSRRNQSENVRFSYYSHTSTFFEKERRKNRRSYFLFVRVLKFLVASSARRGARIALISVAIRCKFG